MKRSLAILILAVGLLVGCGRTVVKLKDISLDRRFCQSEMVGQPYYVAIWTIKPLAAVTIDRIALDPARPHPDVKLITQIAETRNAGGIAGQPWPAIKTDGGAAPKGQNFDSWFGIRPPDGLHIRAHQQVTFGLVVEPTKTGNTTWNGLRVYYDGTSTLIPTALGLNGTAKPGPHCTMTPASA